MGGAGRWGLGLVGAVAAGLVSAVAFGIPLGTLLVLGLALACPLAMMGMHGGHGTHAQGDPAEGAEARAGTEPGGGCCGGGSHDGSRPRAAGAGGEEGS